MAKRHKLWALLGILVFLLLNYPLLHIFNQDVLWAGIPVPISVPPCGLDTGHSQSLYPGQTINSPGVSRVDILCSIQLW